MSRTLIALLLAFAGCSKSEPSHSAQTTDPKPAQDPATAPKPAQDPATAPKSQDPATARQLIAAGAVVLDVRTADEYADGHVPSATNVPVQEVTPRLSEIEKLVGGDKTKPVVVYCAAGTRAAKAKKELEAAGYTHVVNGGGFDDVK
jgi:rhodanese-related sulfurtransferase